MTDDITPKNYSHITLTTSSEVHSDEAASSNHLDPPSEFNFVRHHDPLKPLTRTRFEQIIIWITAFILVYETYYFFGKLVRHSPDYFLLYNANPSLILQFPIGIWIHLSLILFFARLFNRYAVLFGALLAEFVQQIVQSYPVQPIILGFIALTVIWESLKPYKGGEYYQATHIFKQLGYSLVPIGIFLPLLFFLFQISPEFQFSLQFSRSLFRGYLILIFLINVVIANLITWLLLWIMDRLLLPFFPLSDEEESQLQQARPSNEHSDFPLPQPGEVYLQWLTHHFIEEDDHTIVFQLGKVRIYLCTRCTAMIYGVVFALNIIVLLFGEFNLDVNTKLAFWLDLFLPLFPLLDWGLQAVQIRKATTASRIFTGFILGITMQLMPFALGESMWFGLVVGGYFLIFGILYFFRNRIALKKADDLAFQEQFGQYTLNKTNFIEKE